MNQGGTKTKLFMVFLALGALGLLAAGCGGGDEVETDPTVAEDTGDTVQDVPPAVAPEEPADQPDVEAPDYAAMDPADYGVEDVFFAFDEYELSDEAMSILSRNARILRETDVTVVVAGHCDERGTVEYNLALGEKRAKAVKDYLVSLGVSASRLSVTSYGESKPFAMGSTEHTWAQNRRAHFARR